MPGPAVILKELHRLRRNIKDLDTKTEQAPKQLAIQQKKLANQEGTRFNSDIAWSPDGRRIIFSSDREISAQ